MEVNESTYLRWRNQYGGMKSEEANRLKQLEDENKRLKELAFDLSLDNKMLKYISEGN
ncbi:transposase [Gimesia chilikensis]|uniref:transposase n=1 Tax=Gimesia chilikensis TaxID=2605989 RepID=UPI001D158747|nr:transposase [Gimesia chilikensis]